MQFILGRAVSGIGAAGITTGAMRIIAFAVPRYQRPYVEGGCAAILGELACV
jgi:MFS family permease